MALSVDGSFLVKDGWRFLWTDPSRTTGVHSENVRLLEYVMGLTGPLVLGLIRDRIAYLGVK